MRRLSLPVLYENFILRLPREVNFCHYFESILCPVPPGIQHIRTITVLNRRTPRNNGLECFKGHEFVEGRDVGQFEEEPDSSFSPQSAVLGWLIGMLVSRIPDNVLKSFRFVHSRGSKGEA